MLNIDLADTFNLNPKMVTIFKHRTIFLTDFHEISLYSYSTLFFLFVTKEHLKVLETVSTGLCSISGLQIREQKGLWGIGIYFSTVSLVEGATQKSLSQ